jgi:hypothetical protein
MAMDAHRPSPRRGGWRRRTAAGLFLLMAVVLVLLSFLTGARDLELPIGCDEFGYLYLARGIAAGTPFETPTRRPFDPVLVEALEREGFALGSYMYLIAPHAYHFDPRARKVVNQSAGASLHRALPAGSCEALAPMVFAGFIFLPGARHRPRGSASRPRRQPGPPDVAGAPLMVVRRGQLGRPTGAPRRCGLPPPDDR